MLLQHTVNAQAASLTTGSRFLRRTIPVAIAAVLVATVGLGVSRTVTASNDDGPRGCTLATLKGRYLFADAGTLLPPAFGVTQPTPAADAGFHIFNGDGTGTDTVTLRIGTDVVLQNLVIPISYTVNADCTGSSTVTNGPSFDFFISPDGEEFASIATAPAGNYGASIERRVSRR
ncbi:MAG: hypothetical protein ABJA98_02885 [Acidobacteriota bacterium]